MFTASQVLRVPVDLEASAGLLAPPAVQESLDHKDHKGVPDLAGHVAQWVLLEKQVKQDRLDAKDPQVSSSLTTRTHITKHRKLFII